MDGYLIAKPTLDFSVVVPIYNERDNVAPLVEDIVREASKLDKAFEVILVNDGSTDGSAEELDRAAAAHEHVKVIHFAGNQGQTLALAAGMYHAAGAVLVPMDGDRQNDPADIGTLLAKLEEGYDCVSGWRKNRQDSGVRKLPSRMANWIVNRVTGVPIHDLGCTLKAYRRTALDPTELFGEMHRFLAVYAHARGGRIAELVVHHHPRTAGVSKYGLSRAARVIADLILIRILLKYPTRPSHWFAKAAQYLSGMGGVFVLLWLAGAVFHWSLSFGSFWLSMAVMLGCTAFLVLCCGLVCELVMRGRYLGTGRRPWRIARAVGLPQQGAARDEE